MPVWPDRNKDINRETLPLKLPNFSEKSEDHYQLTPENTCQKLCESYEKIETKL